MKETHYKKMTEIEIVTRLIRSECYIDTEKAELQ